MSRYPDIRAGQRMVVDVLREMIPDEVVKSTTETVTSSTTFQNDDELFLAGVANAQYHFTLLLLYSAGTTEKFKMQFTAPAGATVNWGVHNAQVNVTSSGTVPDMSIQSRVLADSQQMGGGNLTGNTAFIEGVFTTSSTAGNLTLQWAQITSGAPATQVRAGSVLKMKRVA